MLDCSVFQALEDVYKHSVGAMGPWCAWATLVGDWCAALVAWSTSWSTRVCCTSSRLEPQWLECAAVVAWASRTFGVADCERTCSSQDDVIGYGKGKKSPALAATAGGALGFQKGKEKKKKKR